MPEFSLHGCRILVVEDEYVLADDLADILAGAGAVVIGPVGSIAKAFAAIAEEALDGAILDINLRGEMAFTVADRLTERNVVFLFATGYDSTIIPERFEQVTRCEKPVDLHRVAAALGKVIQAVDER